MSLAGLLAGARDATRSLYGELSDAAREASWAVQDLAADPTLAEPGVPAEEQAARAALLPRAEKLADTSAKLADTLARAAALVAPLAPTAPTAPDGIGLTSATPTTPTVKHQSRVERMKARGVAR